MQKQEKRKEKEKKKPLENNTMKNKRYNLKNM